MKHEKHILKGYLGGQDMLQPFKVFGDRLFLGGLIPNPPEICYTRSLGALRAPTSSWGPFGPLDFVLRALRALRPVRWARLRSGPPFLTIFDHLDHFRPFGPFWTMLDHFIPFLAIFDHFAHFSPFCTILNHFAPFWTN